LLIEWLSAMLIQPLPRMMTSCGWLVRPGRLVLPLWLRLGLELWARLWFRAPDLVFAITGLRRNLRTRLLLLIVSRTRR
jgi:hypothetical protein